MESIAHDIKRYCSIFERIVPGLNQHFHEKKSNLKSQIILIYLFTNLTIFASILIRFVMFQM